MRPLPDFGFPRLPLFIGFSLVGLSIAAATAGRLSPAHETAAIAVPTAARDLVFEDREDGAVLARAAGSLRMVEVFEGENGFLRGTLRGLARTRRSEQVSPALPFRLAQWPDGRLTLDDPATGRHVELLAFGADNAAVFARLLALAERAS